MISGRFQAWVSAIRLSDCAVRFVSEIVGVAFLIHSRREELFENTKKQRWQSAPTRRPRVEGGER